MNRFTCSFLPLVIFLGACLEAGGDRTTSGETTEVTVLDPSVIVGATEGDPAYLFADITAVAVDDAGRVYVGERIGGTVRAYSRRGEFLGQLARGGQGPGEVDGWPAHLAVVPDGSLYIRDDSRITILGANEPGALPDSLAEVWTPRMYGNLTEARSRVDDEGIYYYPNGVYGPGSSFFYLLLKNGKVLPDTLRVLPYPEMTAHRPALYSLGAGNARILDGFSTVPFSAVPSWDVTQDGTLLSTSGSDPELIETNLTGDTVRVILLEDFVLRPVPSTEREDSLRALEERIDSLPVPLEEVLGLGEGIRERELPTALPFVLGVNVATDGRLWIERWPPSESNARRFDVLESDGKYITTVDLNASLVRDVPLYFGSKAVVGVVRDDLTGVERVVKFDSALPRPH